MEVRTVIVDVAKPFVDFYYDTFDFNRAGLANLYQKNSMLTFEGQKIQGTSNIVANLTSLQECRHSITTVDCQPAGDSGGITGGLLVFVTGNLQVSGEKYAFKFSQMFHLLRTNWGNVIVLNDFFQLSHGILRPEMQVIQPLSFTGAQLLDISN